MQEVSREYTNPKQLNTRKKNLLLGNGGKRRSGRRRKYKSPVSDYGQDIEKLLRIEELENNNDLHAQRVLQHETMEFARTVKLIRLIIEELNRYEKEHEHLNWQIKNK